MSYFRNFPTIEYRFGTESFPTKYQNLGVYLDLVDQAKDDASFYTYYNLANGDRPDVISQKLYNTTDYHWTFFLLNDNIRIQGWPLAYNDLVAKAKKDYPNTTITTRTDITKTFFEGSVVQGKTSGQKAVVLRKHLDLGQIVVGKVPVERTITVTADVKGLVRIDLSDKSEKFVNLNQWEMFEAGVPTTMIAAEEGGEGYSFVEFDFGKTKANVNYEFQTLILQTNVDINFFDGEVISTIEAGVENSAVVDSSALEYLSTHHYEDGNGNYVDIVPNAPFVQRMSVDLKLEGVTSSDIADSEVSFISSSTPHNFAETYDLTDVDERVRQGLYKVEGSVLKTVVAAYDKVIDLTQKKTFGELLTEESSDFQDNFPEDTDFTRLIDEVETNLASIYPLADTNNIKVHFFFLVNNQLEVYLDNDVFGVVYEYVVGGVKTFIVNYNIDDSVTTAFPAATSQSEAWANIATDLELFINQNLNLFNPALYNQVTYLDRMTRSNENLRQIKVFRPEVMVRLNETFQNVLLESQTEEATIASVNPPTGASSVDVSNPSEPVTTVNGITVTTSSASALTYTGSSSGGEGGYY